jgi:two-component system OmpR family sensor kinase
LLLLLGGSLSLVCLVVGSLAVVAINDSLRSNLDQQLTRSPGAGDKPRGADSGDGDHRATALTSCDQVMQPRSGGGDGDLRPGTRPNTVFACISGSSVQTANLFPSPSSQPTPVKASSVLLTVPANGRAVTRDVPGLGDYRFAARHDGAVVLVTGFPLSEVTSQVQKVAKLIALVSVASVLLVLALGWLLLRRALAPLQRVASVAARVSDMPLERGEVALGPLVPDRDADPRTEAGQVGAALNRLLGSVDSALNARHASETRVRQFVADASHELRTPLAAISGYAELTRRHRDALPADTAYALTRVESEAARMTSLVQDLLLLARLDAGRPLERVPVDVTSVVIDAVSDAHAVSQDHVWDLDLPTEPVEVEGDPERLHQVVANLLSNARTHTPAGTHVAVRVRQEGAECVLEVVDDGPGIPPELLPDVFARFARADSSRSRAAGSTGLGLAIVQAIVTAHGGRVGVESRPGRTAFTVRLPARVRAPSPVAA